MSNELTSINNALTDVVDVASPFYTQKASLLLTGETSTKPSRRTRNDNGRETDAQLIRLAKWISIPSMTQRGVRVTTNGLGLVVLDPKPSLQLLHGVRLTNGMADVLPNHPFQVIVANFSRNPRRLAKNTIIVYAKRNPVATLTPERPVAAEMGRVLNILAIPETPSTRGGRTTKRHCTLQQNIVVLRKSGFQTTGNLT